jgi:hypothetical protein
MTITSILSFREIFGVRIMELGVGMKEIYMDFHMLISKGERILKKKNIAGILVNVKDVRKAKVRSRVGISIYRMFLGIFWKRVN